MPSYARIQSDVDDAEEAELRRLERGRSLQTLCQDLTDDLFENEHDALASTTAPHESSAAVVHGPNIFETAHDAPPVSPIVGVLATTPRSTLQQPRTTLAPLQMHIVRQVCRHGRMQFQTHANTACSHLHPIRSPLCATQRCRLHSLLGQQRTVLQ